MNDTIDSELADQITNGEYGPDPVLPGRRRWVERSTMQIDEPPLPTFATSFFGDGEMPKPQPGIEKDVYWVIHEPVGLARRARLLGIEID